MTQAYFRKLRNDLLKVKKELNKFGKTLEKNVLGKVTDLIKDMIIKPPIMILPKPLRNYFLKEINFKKDLGTVIKQLLFVIVKAAMMIMVLVPVMSVMLMPLVASFFKMLATSMLKAFMILFKPPPVFTKPEFINQNLVQPEISACDKKSIASNGTITCNKS